MQTNLNVQQLTKHIKYSMKLTVKVNSSSIYLNATNAIYNALVNPNGVVK